MSNNEKRGFRLPWGGERGPEDGAGAATLERLESTSDTGDETPAGPFRLANTTPEAAMIDSEASTTELTGAPPAVDADTASAWPTTDNRIAAAAIAADRPAIRVDGAPRPTRANPLVAGLVKAMREAAVASRAETTARLQAEATERVDAIRGRATSEAAELKKRADEDVAEIREWSKAELARVRQVTDDRIEARKTELTGEIERHAATVEHLVEQVQTTVSAFEADMDRFFEQLLAENDPAKLAGLAERAPEPPDLSDEAPSAMAEVRAPAVDHTWDVPAVAAEAPEAEPVAEAMAEPVVEAAAEAPMEAAEAAPEPQAEAPVALHSDAAAAAEAEASEGLDPRAIEAWPTVSTAKPQPDAAASSDANGPDSTRLFVHGLTSVAQISSFKGGLAAVRGVKSVSVSSGERGVFIFTVNHDPGVDLDSGVAGLSAFTARVTDATDDGFTVSVGEGGK
ncbi:MAG TPA: hypothetical protein VJ850_11850 [Candidatus Limnocylindrales bacterium]|nr:hypothetical protein [Candidatus Limnocylindrales bacterium]